MNNHTPHNVPAVETLIVKGLENNLRDYFGMSSESVVFISTTDRMRIAERVAKMKGGADTEIQYPLMFISPTSLANGSTDQLHAYNPKSVARHGRHIKVNDNDTQVLTVSLVPTIFEFEVLFVVDSFARAFSYANSWIVAAQANSLNFTVNYGAEALDIRCVMSDTVSTPPREESVDQPNAYEYSTTVRVVGYTTDFSPRGIKEVQIVKGGDTNVTTKRDEGLVVHHSQQSRVI